MREYNLFIIKKEYYDYYRKNPLFLFDILKKLYTLKEDFNYGISLYSQLCERVNPFTLKHFINKKYNLDNNKTFYIDKSFIEIRHTRIIVRSRNLDIIDDLNEYDKYIFVSDFFNNDYFYLNKLQYC